MKRKGFLRKFAWGAASFTLCLSFYLTLAFTMLAPGSTDADAGTQSVPYKSVAEDFSVLLCCEELEQYCLVTVSPLEETVNAVLFDTEINTRNYCQQYDYRVEYTKKTEIDVIGRIGGIVISAKSSYNEYTDNYTQTQRLFGSKVLELAQDPSLRASIAHEFLYSLLGTTISEDDFGYIAASCSDIMSYSDFCLITSEMRRLRKNIIVMIG